MFEKRGDVNAYKILDSYRLVRDNANLSLRRF
jgi:hypothetical protein